MCLPLSYNFIIRVVLTALKAFPLGKVAAEGRRMRCYFGTVKTVPYDSAPAGAIHESPAAKASPT